MSDSPERWSDEWIDQLWLDTISLRGPLRTGEMRDFARAVAREAMEEAAALMGARTSRVIMDHHRHCAAIRDKGNEIAANQKMGRRVPKKVRQAFQQFAFTHPTGKNGHDGWLHCRCSLAQDIRARAREIAG